MNECGQRDRNRTIKGVVGESVWENDVRDGVKSCTEVKEDDLSDLLGYN